MDIEIIRLRMFTDYKPSVGYDEYFCDQESSPRADLAPLLNSLGQMGLEELNRSHASASKLLRRLGATFRLNDSGLKGSERILPFDPLPRLISRGRPIRIRLHIPLVRMTVLPTFL